MAVDESKKLDQLEDGDQAAAESVIDAETAQVVAEKTEMSVTNPGKAFAKAGKRSAAAAAEAEAKEEKEVRKAMTEEEKAEIKQHQPKPTARPKLERRGKKFRDAAKLVDADKQYTLAEAIELAGKTNPVKFDASVELHVNLSVDPRHADQNIRDTVQLPAGTGKTIKIAVFAEADDAEAAKKAGADIVGIEEVTQLLDKGTLDFDVLVATPSQMPKLGRYARMLGPRGLMPNPKSGTVNADVAKAVADAKAGKVEYRVDSTGIIHLGVGKVSFTADQLRQNIDAVMKSLRGNKPSSVKGTYIKAVHLATSMGPSIEVNPSEA